MCLTVGATVGHTLEGIHAVWDARTQTTPEMENKCQLYQNKANKMGMYGRREIQAWQYCGTVWTGSFFFHKMQATS